MQVIFDANLWGLLASIATVLGFIMLIYTAFVALGQLKEMTKTRHLEGILKVYEMIGSQDARLKRRYLYTKLKSKPGHLTPEEREIVEDVCVAFDRIGKLVASGLIPRDELFSSHCEIFIRTWKIVEPHIHNHRKTVGGRYVEHFEKLSKEAESYFSKHFPKQKIDIVDVWSSPNETGKSKTTKQSAYSPRATRASKNTSSKPKAHV